MAAKKNSDSDSDSDSVSVSYFGDVPELEFGPTLSSGLAPYMHEVKAKSGDNIKFVPLHDVNKSFGVWVHRKQVKYDGGFKYVVSGKKLSPPVESPFDMSPDPDINSIKPVRYMLVFVVSGNETLNGHVGFVELRQNLKKRDGTFDQMVKYEDDSSRHSVRGLMCSLKRTGSGLTDTVYQFSITDEYKFTPEQDAVVASEAHEVAEYLKSLYHKVWTPEEFQRIYAVGIVGAKAPVDKPAETEPDFNQEIPF